MKGGPFVMDLGYNVSQAHYKNSKFKICFLDDNLEEEFILFYTCTYEGLELFLIFKDNDKLIVFSNRFEKDL